MKNVCNFRITFRVFASSEKLTAVIFTELTFTVFVSVSLFRRHVTNSLPMWWTCWGNSLARGPSLPKRLSAWWESSTVSSAPSRCNWNRAPVKLSWSCAPDSLMPGQWIMCIYMSVCMHECVFGIYKLYLLPYDPYSQIQWARSFLVCVQVWILFFPHFSGTAHSMSTTEMHDFNYVHVPCIIHFQDNHALTPESS